jgi:glycerol-3-phosphate dehydrogenase (NAD(P)+)
LEVAKRLPTAVTIASRSLDAAEEIQRRLTTPYFRIYTSTDVVGVDLAGALKNVIAIGSGVVAGLNLGFNARAALINRGIVEIARLGVKRGAQPMTFMGLAGMGDLVLTCTGPLSRNLRLGQMLGEGKKLADIQRELGQVAEGVYTAKSAYELAQKENVSMPITEQVYQVLYHDSPPLESLKALMGRELKAEWDVS